MYVQNNPCEYNIFYQSQKYALVKGVLVMEPKLDIQTLVLEENEIENLEKSTHSFGMLLFKVGIWSFILFLVYLMILTLTWGSGSGSGCWGFPGEDCS